MFEQKFFWSFIDLFYFYIHILEKQDENSGVLLNWLARLWYQIEHHQNLTSSR